MSEVLTHHRDICHRILRKWCTQTLCYSRMHLQLSQVYVFPLRFHRYMYVRSCCLIWLCTWTCTCSFLKIISTSQFTSQPNNPVVVQQQPTPVPTTAVVQSASGDNYLTLSVVMTLLVLILGGWPSLMCTMAALLISFNVSEHWALMVRSGSLGLHLMHVWTWCCADIWQTYMYIYDSFTSLTLGPPFFYSAAISKLKCTTILHV